MSMMLGKRGGGMPRVAGIYPSGLGKGMMMPGVSKMGGLGKLPIMPRMGGMGKMGMGGGGMGGGGMGY
jgi:hypothetical protein